MFTGELIEMNEFEVFKRMEKELEGKYPHKVIGMYNGEVISIGDTYDVVVKRLRELGVKEPFIHRLGPSEDTVAILWGAAWNSNIEMANQYFRCK
ncbi:MAG: hypothetical protein EF813_11825 [Methanosarcinales archaeon]|nr:MAG: hypothetical protein EF813_11825 [Methanosarcinales archaeon]